MSSIYIPPLGYGKNTWNRIGITLFFVFSLNIIALAQNITVNGTITDDTNTGLPGVNILIKGTFNGTSTDIDGAYSINVEKGATLVYSFTGYATQEVVVGEQSKIDIILKNDVEVLGEVVVLGYGQSQNKRLTSTAINTISAKQISELPVSRPEAILQGATPGVIVSQNSGSPGSPLTVRLRGVSTAGGAQPLILVDGVQVPDLNFINASDIESYSILKDAAAAAIYGARGGNGVILVQTKKGKRNSDGIQISLDGFYGVQNLGNTPDLMNRDQYISYYNDYATNNGLATISDADRNQLEDTDWYDEVFDDNVPIQSYNLSIANGKDNYNYYLSGGVFDQDGLVGGESGKSNYNRQNLKLHFDTDILDNLNVQVGGNIVRVERDFLNENSAATGTALLNYLPALPAIYPAFDADGNIYDMGQFGTGAVNGVTLPFSGVGAVTNPFLALTHGNNETVSNVTMFTGALTWEPVSGLKLTTSYAEYEDNAQTQNFFEAFDYRGAGHSLFNVTTDYTETDFINRYSQWEGNARYTFENLTNQNLEVLAGFSVLEFYGKTSGRSGSDFFVNTFDEVNFALIKDASTITDIAPIIFESGLLSFYGRVNYSYQDKYLFSATLRRDGSSKFGPDNRFGVFPSFSAGWVLSEEAFLKNSDVIDLFKLRASWGINGNDNIANYQFSRSINANAGPSFGGQNTNGISAGFLPNPSVKWEEVSQMNIGIDINAFNNKLGITLDYYDKQTSDMLVPIGTPAYTGLTSAAANVADVKNTGLEVLVSYRQRVNDNFSWSTSFNLGLNNNEVTGLGDNGQALNAGNIGFVFADPITRTDIGQPIASFYGFEVESVDAQGNFVFVDTDGSGEIDDKDKTFIGNPFPDYTFGWTLGFSYKGFDFNTFLYGSQGNDIYDATVRLDAPYASRPVSYLDVGAPANLIAGATGTDQSQVSDFYVKDGSFMKLKTLTLGYSLPNNVIERIGLSKFRLYVTGQNLLVITDYDGVDPEIGQAFSTSVLDVGIDRGFYPQPQSILFGFQAQF